MTYQQRSWSGWFPGFLLIALWSFCISANMPHFRAEASPIASVEPQQPKQEEVRAEKRVELFQLERKARTLETKMEFRKALEVQKQIIAQLDKKLKPKQAFPRKLIAMDDCVWLYLQMEDLRGAEKTLQQELELCREQSANDKLIADVQANLDRILKVKNLASEKQEVFCQSIHSIRFAELTIKDNRLLTKNDKQVGIAKKELADLLSPDDPLLALMEWLDIRLQLQRSVEKGANKYVNLLNSKRRKFANTRLFAAMEMKAGRFYLLLGAMTASNNATVRSIKTYRRLYGSDSRETAWAYITLGDNFTIRGRLGESLHFYRLATEYFESVEGTGSPGHIMALAGLADLYFKFRKIDQYQECVSKVDQYLKLHVNAPVTENFNPDKESLGQLLRHRRYFDYRGDFKAAYELSRKAVAISEKIHGKKSRSHADYIRELGRAELKANLLKEGLEHLKEAHDLRKSHFARGQQDISRTRFLIGVGIGYQYNGKYRLANEYFAKAIKNARESKESKRAIAEIEYQIGFNLYILKDAQCEDFFCKAADAIFEDSYQNLSSLNADLAVSYSNRLNNCLSGIFLVDVHKNSAKTNRNTLEYLWRIKGTATESIVYRTRLMNSEPEIKNEFRALTKAIATNAMRSNSNSETLARLKQRKNELILLVQKEDRWSSLLFKPMDHKAELKQLWEKLPSDVAIIDISKQFFWEKPKSGKGEIPTYIYYYAYVIKKNPKAKGEFFTKTVILGESGIVDDAIEKFRRQLAVESYAYLKKHKKALAARAMFDMKAVSKPTDLKYLANLKKYVWDPIQPELKDCKTIIVCPGGKFTKFPWAAMPRDIKKMEKRLAEDYSFVTAASPRAILRTLNSKSVDNKIDLLTVADGKYVMGEKKDRKGPRIRDLNDYLLSTHNFYNLPGSKKEANAVEKVFSTFGSKKIKSLSGHNVNRKLVTSHVPTASYVHIATHGFHFDPNEIRNRAKKIQEKQVQQQLLMFSKNIDRNPFLASGIALSIDATDTRTCEFLTAEELLALDLQKIKLLVLSSCDSSLGRINRGEGVFGIQSAILFAGAQSCLASSWKVDDEHATVFMREFYRQHLINGKSKAKSLQLAQKKMIQLKLPPLFWANWTLQGDWR